MLLFDVELLVITAVKSLEWKTFYCILKPQLIAIIENDLIDLILIIFVFDSITIYT